MPKRRHFEAGPFFEVGALFEPPEKILAVSAQPVDHCPGIKLGTILTDDSGKQWRLGKSIGEGGFGEIFLASDNIKVPVKFDTQYVSKIETERRGSILVEIMCYRQLAEPTSINEWKQKNELRHLGVPQYVASGHYQVNGKKYQFLILPRFEKDLEDMLEEQNDKFNLKTVLTIALQLVDVLEYIHSKGYVHSDIKASNILLNQKKTRTTTALVKATHRSTSVQTPKIRKWQPLKLQNKTKSTTKRNKIYLSDYGLAQKYLGSDGEHKKYCKDESKAHAGTILFCSRDAHMGSPSRRSDLESLGYNMVFWLTTYLPWYKNVNDPSRVHKKKHKCIKNVQKFLEISFDHQCPKFLYDYFNYLQNLRFEEEPNYDYIKILFRNALHDCSYQNMVLDFYNHDGSGCKQKKKKHYYCKHCKIKHTFSK